MIEIKKNKKLKQTEIKQLLSALELGVRLGVDVERYFNWDELWKQVFSEYPCFFVKDSKIMGFDGDDIRKLGYIAAYAGLTNKEFCERITDKK